MEDDFAKVTPESQIDVARQKHREMVERRGKWFDDAARFWLDEYFKEGDDASSKLMNTCLVEVDKARRWLADHRGDNWIPDPRFTLCTHQNSPPH